MIKVRVHSFQIIDGAVCFLEATLPAWTTASCVDHNCHRSGSQNISIDNKLRKTNLANNTVRDKGV